MNEIISKRRSADAQMRLLFGLVPLIYHNPGIHLKELRRVAGYRRTSDLIQDLEQIMMFGIVPFGPSDYISVVIEEDRVYLDCPQGLDQPLDLSSSEWLSLQKFIKEHMDFQGLGEHNSEILGDILKKASSIPLEISGADQLQARRALIKEALLDSIQIEFQYQSLASREAELRRISPWATFHHLDQDYVIGFCHTRNDTRTFAVQRMQEIELLDLEIETDCPDNVQELIQQSAIFNDTGKGLEVILGLDPKIHLAVERKLKASEVLSFSEAPQLQSVPGEWIQIKTKIMSRFWLFDLLKGFGDLIVLIKPDFLRKEFAQMLDQRPEMKPFKGT